MIFDDLTVKTAVWLVRTEICEEPAAFIFKVGVKGNLELG
jgi:hypothetical protein